jgi:sugar phosphate isomerase/epimerase
VNRRTFLQGTAAGLAGLGLPRPPVGGFPWLRGLDRIGVQLYTVRDAVERDLEGTLTRVAAIGYQEVEFAGYAGRTAAQVRDAVRRAGLSAPSAHVPLADLGPGWNRILDDAHTVGHRYLVIPWLDEKERPNLDAYRRIADRLNRAGEAASRAGLRLAYHNHDFEFTPMENRLPYDVLLESTDPGYLQLELDLYWITKGGQDPLAYFARWPGRFRLAHVKDSAGPPEHHMADVGAGTIEWARIFAHRKQAGMEHFFVEHDDPPDPFASIAASHAYLKDLEF